MMSLDFTPRNVAKYVAQAIVAGKTAQLTEDAIVDHTRFEEDDMIVDISSHLVGWFVASKLKPVTDRAVDVTADFIAAKREEYKAKKDTPKDTPEEK